MGIELVPDVIMTGIQANEIKITATDVTTGELIERNLKVSFKEDFRGIWLEGTDEFGDPQAIVILNKFGKYLLNEAIAEQPKSWEDEESWTKNSLSAI
ncbi:hypothetical protein [Paenibacillus graminis]|uniref:hypothetical protein n=1 Tax=Paenibacillus graminis TaxID=189425 RepID=UPI002DBB61CB|nr:hypothetical protein [Paenibacillus graminis]MEC0173020.1 hypothetical protein [Paenibacillus graminis]